MPASMTRARGWLPKPEVGIWSLTTLLVGAGLVIALATGGRGPAQVGGFRMTWWELAIGSYLAELAVVHIRFRKDAYSFSLTEVVLTFGLFTAGRWELILGQALGVFAACAFNRRQPPIKYAFNTAKLTLEAGVAGAIFDVLRPANPLSAAALGAACLAFLITTVLGTVLIAMVIALSEGKVDPLTTLRILAFGALGALTNACIAVLAVVTLHDRPDLAWLLVVPLGVVFIAYRAYGEERRQHENLGLLYKSTRSLETLPEVESGIAELLRQVTDIFRAELAEIELFPIEGEDVIRAALTPAGMTSARVDSSEAGRSFNRLVAARPATLVAPGSGEDPELEAHLITRGVRRAMVTGLRGEGQLIGTLVVANPVSAVKSFDAGDLRLFEALATHASTVFEKGWLQARFQHQALHDSLTDLPNRTLLADRVQHALSRRRQPGRQPAVLLLDLDDFKTVNDSLGHLAGDRLLKEVAQRLHGCLRPEDTPARLGGDEFAILVDEVHGPESALGLAERVMSVIREPFRLEGQEVLMAASVGIALAEPGARAEDLLRSADVAMYTAKNQGKGRPVVFEPSMREAVVQRHILKADLEVGVSQGQFIVHYQPMVSVDTGKVTCLEALVRWNHPRRDMVGPDDFIPLAEETGLIQPLGRQVLARACADMAHWRRSGQLEPDVWLSVNVAARQIQDPAYADGVIEILERTGFPAENLVLELTERSVVDDREETAANMRRLHELGVRIAIDDFGTGYSSLSLLGSHRIDIVKIAKGFIDQLLSDGDGRAFSHAILGLGGTLGITTVAEGVETAEQADLLGSLRCDWAQGYFYARPQNGRDLVANLSVAPARGSARPRLSAVITPGAS